MKKQLVQWAGMGVWIVACLSACAPIKTEVGNLNVIPQPQEVRQDMQGNPFVVNSQTCIVYPESNEKMERTAAFLASYIKEATGTTVCTTTRPKEKNSIILGIDPSITHKEGYRLAVTADNIRLTGGSEAGVFYGIQTLYKALPPTKGREVSAAIPAGEVSDYPRFGYRGFMVDVGRHYFPVSYLKQIIDMLALHNINYFHWHLTEDQGWRIEIKKYPKLTEIGSVRPRTLIDWGTMAYDETPHSGFYTQEEAREIVRYAADRFITVIPEIDLPGHMMGALASYPELGCTGGPYEIPCKWGVFPDVLCGGNEQALQLAKDVLNEIMDIFPSPYIHIGGDECPKVRWEKCPKCQAKIRELGLKDTPEHTKENQLQTYFMAEVGKVISDRGRKMLGWDEMLEGGLAPGATVMSWTSVKGGIKAARLHHDAVMTPIQFLYFSNPTYNRIKGTKSLERVYTFEPVPDELTAEEKKHIIGTQGCIWTEWTRDSLKMEWQILPRMAALSEIQWTEPSHKDFDSFLKRLPSLLAVYRDRGYDFRQDIYEVSIDIVPSPEEGKAKIVFHTFDDADIHYTLDGTMPDANSPLYEDTIRTDRDVIIQAVAVRPQGISAVSKEEIHFNAATMKPVVLNTVPHKSYTFKGGDVLIDGLYGDMNYRSGRWIGFYGTDMDVVLDLTEPKEICSAFVNTLLNTGDAIFGATGLKVEVSEDGKNFRTLASRDFPVVEKGTKMQSLRHSVAFDKVKTRYVRMIAKVTPELPAWHSMPGGKAFLFVDELGVE
ncbi:glycoside hydrolase family 20 protein [Phocaeicola sp.]|uniref:glycoside hydrolase family 20 protein n=1 Tax=Phocaeicola sp. TaxID=2773926 RepID=UPI0023BE3888|nr:glycoside hydrolase family 20 protein [Phocaeicola sp.]MDE5676800.1 family 20 glycosylhydrolase [Phocaeicola sp.]